MPKQMKGGSFSVRPGKSTPYLTRKMTWRPAMQFKPGSPQPVVDLLQGIEKVEEAGSDILEESVRERKDRLVG